MRTVFSILPQITNKIRTAYPTRRALPDLRAYRAEDILEARLKLKGELAGFKAGIRDLVWLLYERNDLSGNLMGIGHD